MGTKYGGRPKKPGERYQSGKLRPAAEGIAPSLWARIKSDAMKAAGDPRLASELGRLSFEGHLTNAQTAAGFRVGEIYQRWLRHKRLRDSAKSPSYEHGFGSADLAEERMDDEQLATYEAAIRTAEEEWARVDQEIPVYPRELNGAIFDLCVHDRPVNPTLIPDIREALDRLAVQFGHRWRRLGRPGKRAPRPLNGHAHRDTAITPAIVTPRVDAAVEAVKAIARRLTGNEAGAATVVATFIALRDREKFRATRRNR